MGFLQSLQATLDEEYNLSVTENGAIGYRTTGSSLLDLNFAVTSLRHATVSQIQTMFAKAYFEDKLLAIKWMFFAGDVRGGLGERRLFRICLQYLADNHPTHARRLLPLVAHYTRWDNLFCLLGGDLQNDVLALMQQQLDADLQSMKRHESVSLLAKWLPSVNASSKQTRTYANIIIRYLHCTAAEYRKTLAALRRYTNVLEVKMSAGQWGDIVYEEVPSKANLAYNKAFLRNDNDRRSAYLAALQAGKTTINAGVLFPHEIVTRYKASEFNARRLLPRDPALEGLWKALPNYVNEDDTTLCVADGSGSMTAQISRTRTTCLDVANALAIYFAERCNGEFKDKYITFSEHPQLVDLSKGDCLRDKLEIAYAHNEVANTDLEAVFNLILRTAVKGNMKQRDLPKNILILSDMEFDYAVSSHTIANKAYVRLFTEIGRNYAQYGYRLPRLVFWNIHSTTKTIPVVENDMGVALVSGFSPIVVKMVLSNKLDPYEVLLDMLDTERYDAVQSALEGL